MGQDEIVKLLKKFNGQWFNSGQIEKLLGGSTVSVSLGRLRRHSEIKFKPNPRRNGCYLYSY